MTNLKLVKGGKDKEDSNAPDYTGVGLLAILNLGLLGFCWMLKFFFETVSNSPQSKIEAGNGMFIGLSIVSLSIVGIALGKEMSDSPNKNTSRFGTAIFCYFMLLSFYGAYHMTFK